MIFEHATGSTSARYQISNLVYRIKCGTHAENRTAYTPTPDAEEEEEDVILPSTLAATSSAPVLPVMPLGSSDSATGYIHRSSRSMCVVSHDISFYFGFGFFVCRVCSMYTHIHGLGEKAPLVK